MSIFKNIIQIGSFIGNTENDPIFNSTLCSIDAHTRLFLVEPVPRFFNQLCKNYAKMYPNYYSNIVFINKAITNYVGEIGMYVPALENDYSKYPPWVQQLSSVYSDHISHYKIRNPNIPYENLVMHNIKVPATTLNEIIKEYQISSIELLQIDTEGHDYDILMHYDFVVKPQKIIFEHKHIPTQLCNQLVGKLFEMGYRFISFDSENAVFVLRHYKI